MSKGWIGVDLDGTLAHYDIWRGPTHIGEPVPAMVERVKRWLSEGRDVRIFTARVWPITVAIPDPGGWRQLSVLPEADVRRANDAVDAAAAVAEWCYKHLGRELTITCVKDMAMIELWDDRAVQVIANTGDPVGASTRGLS